MVCKDYDWNPKTKKFDIGTQVREVVSSSELGERVFDPETMFDAESLFGVLDVLPTLPDAYDKIKEIVSPMLMVQ